MAISNSLLNGIHSLQQGNAEGFNIIYSETASYVYSKARMLMKNEHDANDLVQETFIQAYNHIGSLSDPQNIFAWLGAIAYRQGMKIYRKKNEVLLDEDGEGIFSQIEDSNISWSPELSAEQQAVGNIVSEIIDELPPLQKAALTAFYYDGLKIDQIAEMYECSSNTIKSRLNYAKKYVREKIELREKQDGVVLHSVGGISIFYLGLRQLLTSSKYVMSPAIYNQIYSSLFHALQLGAASVAAASASTATAAISGTSSSATSASSVASLGSTGTKAATAAKASSKLVRVSLIAGSVLSAGALTAGVLAFTFNLNSHPIAMPEPKPVVSEQVEGIRARLSADTQAVSEILDGPQFTDNTTGPTPDSTEPAVDDAQQEPEEEPTVEPADNTSDTSSDDATAEEAPAAEKKEDKKDKKKEDKKKETTDDDDFSFGDESPDLDANQED